jgi:hypothetical protein
MFNLNDYEDVDTRIHKFYEKYPDGAIHTEEIHYDEEKGVVIFRAMAFRTFVDDKPAAIGYARGMRKDRGVDRDFWYENCETSSIGRCMANLSLSAKGKRASALEMAKVADSQAGGNKPIRVRTEEQKKFINERNPQAEVIWDTTIEPPADLEPDFEDAVNTVIQGLSAEPVPTCKHGNRVLREGHGKNGAYRGWGCPIPMKRKAEQCKMYWMVLDQNGKWSFRAEDAEEMAG